MNNFRWGFTLIELLIVMSILAILMAMLLPILRLAQRSSERTAAIAVMHKIDTAARLFRNDIGAYPWQRAYADSDSGTMWTNRLGYQLGARIDTSVDLPNLRQDADAVALKYAYDCTTAGVEPSAAVLGTFAFRKADIQHVYSGASDITDVWPNSNYRVATAAVLNRMAAELARVEVFAGNPDVCGLRLADVRDLSGVLISVGRDNSAVKLLAPATPASSAKPGWADDYLLGEIESRYRNGDAILDPWGTPLILVSQIHEGAHFARTYLFSSVVSSCDLSKYSLNRRGRILLVPVDPLTGVALIANPPALPDPSNLRHSDRRMYGALGFEGGIELWSAGPDRQFSWMRDDQRNMDNVPLLPYDKALP